MSWRGSWSTSSCIGPTRSAAGSRTIADPELSTAEAATLLRLARQSIEAAVTGCAAPDVPPIPAAGLLRGAFVTLHDGDGELRGCIGHVDGDRPLGEVIRQVAVSAARSDPRFPPVTADEMAGLRLDISVLGAPVPMVPPRDPARLHIGRDGLLLRRGGRHAVLLPQVATDHGFTATAFLAAVCEKAGLGPESWREPETQLFTFSAHVLAE